MDNKRIAKILYNLGCDVDIMDYSNNLEGCLTDIENAIEHLKDLGEYNEDFKLLFNVIEMVAIANEYTRDFVNEIRGCK